MLLRILIAAGLMLTLSGSGLTQDTPEEGKPASCDNYKQTPEGHRCHCARDEQKCDGIPQPPADVEMDARCKTYCRKQNCHCAGHGCTS